MGETRSTPAIPPHLALIVGVLVVSAASIFIRLAQAGADSLAVAAWRLTLASAVLAPFALATSRSELRGLTRKECVLILAAGVLLALHFATWISSLALTSVAASVVLMTTHPLLVGVMSHFLLKERLTPPMIAGVAVAFGGSTIIGLGDLGQGTHRLTGDLLALAGGLTVAGYFLIGRKLRARLSLLGYVFPVYATAALVLMGTAIVARVPLSGYTGSTWLWLLVLALGPQILGHSSLNYALRQLSATYVTLAVLAEPIGSALLAWAVLGERPTLAGAIGGGLILAGIAVATWGEPRARRAAKETLPNLGNEL
jgi:drug/metabolite transporter (DMT)-like permease